MAPHSDSLTPSAPDILAILKSLRWLDEPPNAFWPAFLQALSTLLGAQSAEVLSRDEEFNWQRRAAWPGPKSSTDFEVEQGLAETAESNGFVVADEPHTGLVAGRLDRESGDPSSVVIFTFGAQPIEPQRLRERFMPLADIPVDYLSRRRSDGTRQETLRAVEALDIMTLLNDCERYQQGCMTFCNEIATRFGADRVNFGWLQGGYIHLQAVSHIEKFDRKMALAQTIEAVMEETYDQDAEIVWPRRAEESTVVREHQTLATVDGIEHLLSMPLRLEGEPVAVLLSSRHSKAFSDDEIKGLRIICDQVIRRLDDLREQSRWFGARWAAALSEQASQALGPEHTAAKLGSLVACAFIAFLLFGSWNYRVDGNFILRTEALRHLPAPFDGYIEEVHAEIGDRVESGELLLELNTDSLLLEESEAIAGLGHRRREEEKARAAERFADMRIAVALKDQAATRLDEIRYRLAKAAVVAPRAGVVVEGELKELRGAPVQKGSVLFKVAGLDQLYVEIELDERDVHHLSVGSAGEISFVSRPGLEFPVRIERIDPAARVKDGQNQFVMKAVFSGEIASWWRPGMSGVARIDIGERMPLWVLTHRTVDFLRLYFWQ